MHTNVSWRSAGSAWGERGEKAIAAALPAVYLAMGKGGRPLSLV